MRWSIGLEEEEELGKLGQKAFPKGPRTQIVGVSGPNYYNINGILALKPYNLGPWTLRVLSQEVANWWP